MVIKVDFSSCFVSKKWSQRSESIFDLLYLKAVIRMIKLEFFLTLSQCCDQQAQTVLILPTLTNDQRAQRCFQPMLHFKGLIRELIREFWSELSQRGDQRAQTLAFYFLSLTAVIKELKLWFSSDGSNNVRSSMFDRSKAKFDVQVRLELLSFKNG